MRLAPLLVTMLAALLLAAPASATISDRIDMAPPSGSSQLLTVAIQDDANTQPVPLAATYRAVAPTSQLSDTRCPTSVAADPGARLIDEVTPAQPYSVQRAVELPLSLHLVCLYRSGSLTSQSILGTYQPNSSAPPAAPGTKPKPIILRLLAHRISRTRGQIGARIVGLPGNEGAARLQRRIGRHWHTETTARVRRGLFLRDVKLRRGQRWRVYVPATAATAAAASRSVPVR